MLALFVITSGFSIACAMQASDAINGLTPEECKFAEEQAAKKVQDVVDKCGDDKELLKASLLGRIKHLGKDIFIDNAKALGSGMFVVAGSVLFQAILAYEIIFAAVALYACFYGVTAVSSYLLIGSNVLVEYSPIALFQLTHGIYLGALYAANACGAIVAFGLLCFKFFNKVFPEGIKIQIRGRQWQYPAAQA